MLSSLEVLTWLLMDQISLTVLSPLSIFLLPKLIWEALVIVQWMNWISNSCQDMEANWIQKCAAHLAFSERSFKRHLGLGSHPIPFWLKIGSTSQYFSSGSNQVIYSWCHLIFSLFSHLQCILCFPQACSISDLYILLDKISANLSL